MAAYWGNQSKVSASLLADNGQNCYGSIFYGGYNLQDDALDCLIPSTDHNLIGVNPYLGALANNGGPTSTEAITAVSPAHDAVPASTGVCTGTDQRGVSRLYLYGTSCDIGAYQYIPPPPKAALVPTAVSFGDRKSGSTTTRTVILSDTGDRPLGVTKAAVTGTGFRLVSTTCMAAGRPVPLDVSSSCLLTLAFTPVKSSAYVGALTLTDNDGGTQIPTGATQTMRLSGSTLPPINRTVPP
jgi:hypothetical protein